MSQHTRPRQSSSFLLRRCAPWVLFGQPVGTGTQYDTELIHKLKQYTVTTAKAALSWVESGTSSQQPEYHHDQLGLFITDVQ